MHEVMAGISPVLALESNPLLASGHGTDHEVRLPLASPPAERSRQTVRYERGSHVYAADGLVGTLRQVVVDEDTGDIQALVVRMTARKESVLVPPELVTGAVGSSLVLNMNREQFVAGASRSPRYAPRMFAAADRHRVLEAASLLARDDPRRSLVTVSADAVETSDETAAAAAEPAAGLRGGWPRFRRR